MNEEMLYQKIGRLQMAHEALLLEYRNLLGVIAQIQVGALKPEEVILGDLDWKIVKLAEPKAAEPIAQTATDHPVATEPSVAAA